MRITVIGAGFSGSALANELLAVHSSTDVAGTQIEVCLVGVPETYGRGVAYGDARPEHVLNVRASDMSATPDAPDDFADWLNLTERARASFLPRLVYGEYLYERLRSLADAAPTTLRRIELEAVAVERASGGFRVHLADGSDFLSDRVVLAVGALPPQPLAGVGPRLAIHPSYLGWPWQDGAIDRIPNDARVLIVGTGLTMADVAVTLRKRGHTGPIAALSRHGLLPKRHLEAPSPAVALPPAVLHALDTHDLRELVRAVRTLSSVVGDWRSLVDALRPHLQWFWRSLPDEQRGRFLRHLRSHWESVRHRLAPQVAAELDLLQIDGQLDVRAGRMLRARRGADDIEVLIRDRGRTQASIEHYDVLVRATGLDVDIERTTHVLVAHMRESGLISADPHGLGVRTTDRFEAVDPHGRLVAGLFCLGPLLRGGWWEITAVPELRVAARELARRLIAPPARNRAPETERRGIVAY